jgi:hypothetical protein
MKTGQIIPTKSFFSIQKTFKAIEKTFFSIEKTFKTIEKTFFSIEIIAVR